MGWISLDSNFYKELKTIHRKFTRIEAAFCLTYDMNYNRKKSINQYSIMWGWSRHKTRDFLENIKSASGSIRNGKKNIKGHPIRLIGNGSKSYRDIGVNQSGHPKAPPLKVVTGHKDTQCPKRTPLNHC